MKQLLTLLLIAGCISAAINAPPPVKPKKSSSRVVEEREEPEATPVEIATTEESTETPAPDDGGFIFAEVTEVLDGNTVKLLDDKGQSRTVDLYGIDAPRRPPFGRDATNVLKHYTIGKRVLLKANGTDSYGQNLGVIYSTDGESIGLKLLSLGMASHNVDHTQSESYAEIQRTTQRSGAGIWAESRPVAATGYDTTPRVQREAPRIRQSSGRGELIVYVTEYGNKYHRSDCKHLAQSKQEIALSRAKPVYGPCEDCRPPE